MGNGHLIDSNILIYHVDGLMPAEVLERVKGFFKTSFLISTITKIEVLSFYKLDDLERRRVENFCQNAHVFFVNEAIQLKTIEVKRQLKIKTPDAIIAATALVHDLTLVTRNVSDFEKLPGLKLYNPFGD